ncbi:hypothetical protein [uncultured Algibacter sp.]|uniref:hypothetical protein n=1 Tax=uncultured Algibacter sp. TaxID=298659 RepID=UPI0032163B0F
MNILKAKFPTVLKVVMVCAVLFSFSCSGDDDGGGDPAGVVFVELPASVLGEYEGDLTYTSGVPITNDSGTATIVSAGDNVYNITFSDNIPALIGFRFIKSEEGKFESASTDGSSEGVAINGDELSVGVTQNTANWAFSGSN